MMINDLSVSKELDGQAVRGGFGDTNQANFAGGAVAVTNSFGSIGTTSLAVAANQQTNINAPYLQYNPTAVALLGSTAWAA
jgi:hypothetical protein